MKLATHNSATGERSKNLLHSFFSIFAKCQDKTIREQYEAGVRYFDLRVDKDFNLCHGLWKANKNLRGVVKEMAHYVADSVYVSVTIEHNYSEETIEWLKDEIFYKINLNGGGKVELVYIARKKPEWSTLVAYRNVKVMKNYLSVPTPKEYLTLAHKDWRRYIPIPRVLKKITPAVEYDGFVMRDFV